MTVADFYKTFSSDCTAGSANQIIRWDTAPVTKTGRCYYKLSHGGTKYSLLFSNTADSTYGDGSLCTANKIGGTWEIKQLRVGICSASLEEPKEWHECTFDGLPEKIVSGDTVFYCDPIDLNAKAKDVLCYEITLSGACFPYHEEINIPVVSLQNGAWVQDKQVPVPVMIGSNRSIQKRIAFIGDSITQGCGTVMDSYTHWVAVIAEHLPESYSVWDLGIGYARAYDAATDKGWLARAKTCDIVNVCLGANDLLRGRTADEVIADLQTIVSALSNAGCRVVLFTVPPFDMTGQAMENWYAVNAAIRAGRITGTDQLFDFARTLGQKAPMEHCSVYGGHPNAAGCSVAANAYLDWSNSVQLFSDTVSI